MALHVAEGFVRRSFQADYPQVLAALLDPLDETSRAVVEKVIARHRYILINNLLQHCRLYETQEIANCRILRKSSPKLAAELGIPMKLTEASVLYYHHGLRHTDLPVQEFTDLFARRDIIDVDAASGDSTCIFRQNYPCRWIHSFEPRASRLPIMRSVLKRHRLDRITLIELG